MVHCGLREKRHGIARVDENLAVPAAFLFDARFRSRGHAHSKIATADKRGKIRKLLRSHGSGDISRRRGAEERSINPASQFGNLGGLSIFFYFRGSSDKDPLF